MTFSCFRAFVFLKAERTCQWLSDAIETARKELDFALWAYVFMPEHVHLLICPRRPIYDISTIRQAIREPVGRKGDCLSAGACAALAAAHYRETGKRLERHFWQAGGGDD